MHKIFVGALFFAHVHFVRALTKEWRSGVVHTKRIVCIGDSVTQGCGGNDHGYLGPLQRKLGDDFEVLSFAHGAATAIQGKLSYFNTSEYKEALKSQADVVVIMFGTSDTRLVYTKHNFDKWLESFKADYSSIIHMFQELPTHPKVFLMVPPACYPNCGHNLTFWHGGLSHTVAEIAHTNSLSEPIDIYKVFETHCSNNTQCDWVSDDFLHPSQPGYDQMANAVYRILAREFKLTNPVEEEESSTY